jgi:hypothetical protein
MDAPAIQRTQPAHHTGNDDMNRKHHALIHERSAAQSVTYTLTALQRFRAG